MPIIEATTAIGRSLEMARSKACTPTSGATAVSYTSPVTRTLYKSEYGPMVNLTAFGAPFAWSQTTAFAIRDINGENYRTFRNWLRWNQAKSLDEFIAIQREESAIPWVNTVAVGRGAPKAWYADIGAVPNVSPAQVARKQ